MSIKERALLLGCGMVFALVVWAMMIVIAVVS